MRWEIGGEIKKIINAQKNVHKCTFFCAKGFYPDVS